MGITSYMRLLVVVGFYLPGKVSAIQARLDNAVAFSNLPAPSCDPLPINLNFCDNDGKPLAFHSNLGGNGPDKGHPEEFRVYGVAAVGGTTLDLVIKVAGGESYSSYRQNKGKNGGGAYVSPSPAVSSDKGPGCFITLPLKVKTQTKFHWSLVKTKTNDLYHVNQLRLSLLDLDQETTQDYQYALLNTPVSALTKGNAVAQSEQDGMIKLQSTEAGGSLDNPASTGLPLSIEQKQRSVELAYVGLSHWEMTLGHSGGSSSGDRVFQIWGSMSYCPEGKVTCVFTVDNKLHEMYYNDQDVINTVIPYDPADTDKEGALTKWSVPKNITFIEAPGAVLAIGGQNNEAFTGTGTCTSANGGGLSIKCSSTESTSAWNNWEATTATMSSVGFTGQDLGGSWYYGSYNDGDWSQPCTSQSAFYIKNNIFQNHPAKIWGGDRFSYFRSKTGQPAPAKTNCIKIVTGQETYNNGKVEVEVDTGDITVLWPLATYAKGTLVLEKCFTNVLHLHVRNSDNDAWAGSVEYSTNGGSSYASMLCTDCTKGTDTSKIVVDGNTDGANQADNTCIEKTSCKIEPRGDHCLAIYTGNHNHNDGELEVEVDTGDSKVVWDIKKYAKEATVIEECFKQVVRVQVKNPTNDAWSGSILFKPPGGTSYSGMWCTDCTKGTDTSKIVVDGNTDGADQADTQCLAESSCNIQPV